LNNIKGDNKYTKEAINSPKLFQLKSQFLRGVTIILHHSSTILLEVWRLFQGFYDTRVLKYWQFFKPMLIYNPFG